MKYSIEMLMSLFLCVGPFTNVVAQTNDTAITGVFQPTIAGMENLFSSGTTKTQFEKSLPPLTKYVKTDKLERYNPKTHKFNLYSYSYCYSGMWRNTVIEIRIEADDENSPIKTLKIETTGIFWHDSTGNAGNKTGQKVYIKADYLNQSWPRQYKSQGMFQSERGANEAVYNTIYGINFFEDAHSKMIITMWKHKP